MSYEGREVAKYLDTERAYLIGVAALPDQVYQLCRSAHAQAFRRGVILVPTPWLCHTCGDGSPAGYGGVEAQGDREQFGRAVFAGLSALTDESLAEKMNDAFGRPSTRAALLGSLAIHQCYHAGQLGMARRAAGRKTAILAPGQTAPL